MVDPETDPGEHDNQHTGKVGLEDEVADGAFELKDERQALVRAGGRAHNPVLRLVASYCELGYVCL